MRVKGSVVLIAGAENSIGQAFACELLKEGASKVYLGIKRLESVIGLAAHAPGKLVPIQLDVTNQDHIDAARRKAGDTNILVNNSGFIHGGSLSDRTLLQLAKCEMEDNYFGPLRMIQSFAPVLARNGGGAIMNIISVAGLIAIPGLPTYSPSEAALHFLTLETRMELAEQGTRVLGIYPGPLKGDMETVMKKPKNDPAVIARESIKALKGSDDFVFPDPKLKSIYKVLQKGGELTREMDDNIHKSANRAA